PFEYTDQIISGLKSKYKTKMTVIDFHAEATSEKQAFIRYFDGQVSLIVGTHTHVQTADEGILERGTGFITDVGMTGPVDSVIGMETNSSIKRFVERIPVPYMVAKGESMLSFIVAKIDERTGQTTRIQRMCIK
ncbi:MAG: YmdB family metallophosphoesterase, partial [Saccharofermentanales bacterium]